MTIQTKICKQCGVSFKRPPFNVSLKTFQSRKFCNLICSKKFNAGKNHYLYNKKHLEKTKKKISFSLIGRTSPMKGRKSSEKTKELLRKLNTGKKNGFYGRKHTEETKKKLSKANKGRKHSEETKKKMRGKKISEETRRKMSESHKGDKCHLWKGGLSFLPYTIDWTETLKRSIRERDRYICQVCNQYGHFVHHIDYDKKNCNTKNLITLCQSCHSKTNQNRNYWIKYFNKTL